MKPTIINIDHLTVEPDRFRESYTGIEELAESIEELGLIQPLVVESVEDKIVLVAGGRRTKACQYLFANGRAIRGLEVGQVPVVLAPASEGDELSRAMLEYTENEDRVDFDWKEKCKAIARIHKLNLTKSHLVAENWTMKQTGRLLNLSAGNVHYCVNLSLLLKDSKHPIQQAESLSDAFRILLQLKEDETKAKDANRSVADVAAANDLLSTVLTEAVQPVVHSTSASEEPATETKCVACEGTGKSSAGHACPICKGGNVEAFVGDVVKVPLSKILYLGDSEDLIRKLPDESVDHILSDPPYAIDMDHLDQGNPHGGMNDIDRIRETHDVEENLKLLDRIFPELYRVLRKHSFCCLFYDNVHWEFLSKKATSLGFKVQRWPLVWVKTSTCMNQCASFNFTKATEFVLVLRKGNATLACQQPTNSFPCPTPDKRQFDHPFAKPPDLLSWILRAFALPGQTILDPFCGSATAIYAAGQMGLRPIGFEKDPIHYNEANRVLKAAYTAWMLPRKVEFI